MMRLLLCGRVTEDMVKAIAPEPFFGGNGFLWFREGGAGVCLDVPGTNICENLDGKNLWCVVINSYLCDVEPPWAADGSQGDFRY